MKKAGIAEIPDGQSEGGFDGRGALQRRGIAGFWFTGPRELSARFSFHCGVFRGIECRRPCCVDFDGEPLRYELPSLPVRRGGRRRGGGTTVLAEHREYASGWSPEAPLYSRRLPDVQLNPGPGWSSGGRLATAVRLTRTVSCPARRRSTSCALRLVLPLQPDSRLRGAVLRSPAGFPAGGGEA